MKKNLKAIIVLCTILPATLFLPPMVQAKAQIPYQFRESVTKEKEIAATFSKNKKGQTKRYYKIVATKNRLINYSAGILYDSQGKMVPSRMHKEIYPVYGKEPDSFEAGCCDFSNYRLR